MSNKRFLTIVLFKSSIEHYLENVMPNYRDEQKVVLGIKTNFATNCKGLLQQETHGFYKFKETKKIHSSDLLKFFNE